MNSLGTKRAFQYFISALLAVSSIGALSVSAAEFSRPDVENVSTELIMELKVNIGAPVTIGESDAGVRRFIPITGGSFEGRNIQGEVIPGGADWQVVRRDGVTEVKAIYAIRTDDGAVIAVDNRGIAVNVPATQDGSTAAFRYTRTRPLFQAPQGKYQWLNERLFNGTITVGPGGTHVIIRVFEVK